MEIAAVLVLFDLTTWPYMSQVLPVKERKSFCKDMLPLASEPLWFLETSITEVAWGACASKSSMQDALIRLTAWRPPRGHIEMHVWRSRYRH